MSYNNILKYPGSKWGLANELVRYIPKHHTYVEPFFGSGAVFFKKPPSPIEMINDLDNDVTNLFRCVRDDPDRLAASVAATPFSRSEYDDAFMVDAAGDSFARARRFLIRSWQGHGFRTSHKVGWKNDVQGRERMYALWNWYRLPEWIMEIMERLRTVQIDNRPAVELIRRFNFSNVFMYVDPPYIMSTRSGKNYKYEMDDSDHEELLEILKKSKAKIMLSGYQSGMYDSVLCGWEKVILDGRAEYGGKREEVIWMNYQDWENRQMTLEDVVNVI